MGLLWTQARSEDKDNRMWSHMFQNVPAGLFDQLIGLDIIANVLLHILCRFLKELQQNQQEDINNTDTHLFTSVHTHCDLWPCGTSWTQPWCHRWSWAEAPPSAGPWKPEDQCNYKHTCTGARAHTHTHTQWVTPDLVNHRNHSEWSANQTSAELNNNQCVRLTQAVIEQEAGTSASLKSSGSYNWALWPQILLHRHAVSLNTH